MANLIFGASAPMFLDSPTQSGLETLVNALFAPLLSHEILGVGFTSQDEPRRIGNELRVAVSYSTGGTVITHPYLVKGFEGQTIDAVVTLVLAYMAANPSYFFAPLILQQINAQNRQPQVVGLLPYNTNQSDGAANWFAGGNASGGAPGGAAGGDLSGTYPSPSVFAGQLSTTPLAVITTLDSVSAAAYKSMKWAIEAVKATTTWYSEISCAHDGTTPVWVEDSVVLAPGAGTFDFTNSVDISGGLLRLRTTPSTTGWTFRVRQLTRLAA